MSDEPTPPGAWTPEFREATRLWAENWKRFGPELERIRREELRRIDQHREIELLCGDFDYTVEPRKPKPTSGIIEMQRLFMKALRRE